MKRLGLLLMLMPVLTSNPSYADYVLLKKYSDKESLYISSGKSSLCKAWGLDSDRPLRIRETTCVDRDGAYRRLQDLQDVNRFPLSFSWTQQLPNQVFEGTTFFPAVGESEKRISEFFKSRGKTPILQAVRIGLLRSREAGDFIIPFCYSTTVGCHQRSNAMDGFIVIRRSDRYGTYIVRNIMPKTEYCLLTDKVPLCQISQHHSMSRLPYNAPWASSSIPLSDSETVDYFATNTVTNTLIPEAERMQYNEAGEERFRLWAKQVAEATKQECLRAQALRYPMITC